MEAKFQLRVGEVEQQLRDKRAECDNLEWMLKDRAEKVAAAALKSNEYEKENIRLKKRLENLSQSNKDLKARLFLRNF